jgi:hypothetical protein
MPRTKFACILNGVVEKTIIANSFMSEILLSDYFFLDDSTDEKRLELGTSSFYLILSSDSKGSVSIVADEEFYSLMMSSPLMIALSEDSEVTEGFLYNNLEFTQPE